MISIVHQPIDPWQAVKQYQETSLLSKAKFGATSIFIGTMRDVNEGCSVQEMVLEYYPGMTEKQLDKIIIEAKQRWQILDCLVIHRVGLLKPDETIVVLAVWASHRGDAFDACRFMMEALKSSAPFWKKETQASGDSHWVEKNTDGYAR